MGVQRGRRAAGAIVAVLAAAVAAGAGTAAGAPVRSGSAARPALRATQAAAYPLRVNRTRRHLVDRRGRPFMIVGDSPQALMVNASPRGANRFFANRAAYGFNAAWVNLLCATYTGGREDGTTYDGLRPFRRAGDLATPNRAYFARAARMVRLAARHGIAVFLDPIETGSWLDVLRRNGAAKAYAYGRFLGRRFGRLANIVWFNGNDFQSWEDAGDDRLVRAVARGIRSTDPHHLQTLELNYLVSASLDDARWKGLIDLDAAYTYSPTYSLVRREYRRRDHLPVFMVEANYEDEHDFTGPQTLRRQEYWTMLSGATGQFYGNKYTWPMVKGWPQHLNTAGSRQLSLLVRLFAHRRWYALVPDLGHTLVTSGYGLDTDGGTVNENDYVTAARTRDGRLAMAYTPTGSPFEVDLGRLHGRVRASWYDPAAGRYVRVSGSPFRSRGKRTFTPPAANGDGEHDWVLVLASR
jgi:hypothetical protein